MQVEVLIFGAASFGAKTDRVTVEVSAAPTVREVLACIARAAPGAEVRPAAARVWPPRREAFLRQGRPRVRPGDEVPLITLVGGG